MSLEARRSDESARDVRNSGVPADADTSRQLATYVLSRWGATFRSACVLLTAIMLVALIATATLASSEHAWLALIAGSCGGIVLYLALRSRSRYPSRYRMKSIRDLDR